MTTFRFLHPIWLSPLLPLGTSTGSYFVFLCFLVLFLCRFGFSLFQNIFVRCSESLLLSFSLSRIIFFVFFRSSVRFSFIFFLAFLVLAFGLFGRVWSLLCLPFAFFFFIFIQLCVLLLGPSALLACI